MHRLSDISATLPTPTRDTIAIVPGGHNLVAELIIAVSLIFRVTEIASTHSSWMSEDDIHPILPFQYDGTSFEGVPPPQKVAILRKSAFSHLELLNRQNIL